MHEALLCPLCGKSVPAEAPMGMCPACVMQFEWAKDVADQSTIAPALGHDPDSATLPPTPARPGVETVAPPLGEVVSEPASTRNRIPFADIPGYEILGELGRGGMGVVYQARHKKLGRLVALKMILAGGHASEAELTRFRIEAEAIARVKHPNIIQIYEIGEHEGKPYFSLEFCGGGSLAQKIDGTPMQPKEAAHIIEKLARGMDEAHREGIIHRDLKPANVLFSPLPLGEGPGVREFGTPKITDFGLAKKLGDAGQTQSGAVMGTPSYMAPEQAGGKPKVIGPAVDIYALGAVLYELLTGRPPFKAATPLDTVLQVLERDPAPPRLLNPNVDRDVETICLKCLEKDPSRRYATAQALADDLERYRLGEAITARSLNLVGTVAFALERSHYDALFPAYNRLFFGYALLMPACETARYAAYQTDQSVFAMVAIETVRLAAIFVLYFWLRPRGVRVTGPAKRLLWTVWSAYVLTLWVVGFSHFFIQGGWSLDEDRKLYPVIAAVTGMAFYVLGSSYWGWCFAVGLAFHLLALVMLLDLRFAPLEHGALWAIVLGTIAFRLRRMSMADHPFAPAVNA